MKKLTIIGLFSLFLLVMQSSVLAQRDDPSGAIKKINPASEQADKLTGRKIQQQSLGKSPESLNPPVADTSKKKIKKKPAKKH